MNVGVSPPWVQRAFVWTNCIRCQHVGRQGSYSEAWSPNDYKRKTLARSLNLIFNFVTKRASPQRQMSSIVNVFVVSPDTRSERRFDLHITVEQLKVPHPLMYGCIACILITHHHASGQARAHYGHPSTKPEDLDRKQWRTDLRSTCRWHQTAWILRPGELADVEGRVNSSTFGRFNFTCHCIQVTDTNPSTSFTGQLSDVSQVEKFELSDEAYAKRTGPGIFLYATSTTDVL